MFLSEMLIVFWKESGRDSYPSTEKEPKQKLYISANPSSAEKGRQIFPLSEVVSNSDCSFGSLFI